ncbi:hypothetical protein HGRIS_000955 [Hohenbuehelia grisea]|uniref:Uncharacterized protein n=1 Tax=Hohenbuehelia grisea TaxID=104357 RepID=A0ABR3IQ82_9AGAR
MDSVNGTCSAPLSAPTTELKGTGAPLSRSQLVAIYNTFLIIGLLILTLVLVTAILSRQVQRASTWFMFITAWIIVAISYLLLGGSQLIVRQKLSWGLCLAQAAFIYASIPATAFATLGFTIQLYYGMSGQVSDTEFKSPYIDTPLIVPPLIFVLVALEVVTMGLNVPQLVDRDHTHMYCHLNSDTPVIVNLVLVGFCVLMILYLEASTIRLMRKNWAAFVNMRVKHSRPFSPGMVVRLVLFSIGPLLTLIIGIVEFSIDQQHQQHHPHLPPRSLPHDCTQKKPHGGKHEEAICHIFLALLPGIAGATFGSQTDMLRAWAFWRKDAEIRDDEKSNM